MSDNVAITAGVGTTIATDDVGGVQYQRVKLDFGADGATAPATAATPLPVVQTGALAAGTNAIGKLAANSGVDIGDVDVTSLPALVAGTANIGDVDVLTLPATPAGTNIIGFATARLDQLNISQTPTVTSGAYAANDAMGGLLTFANAARVSGSSGIVQAVTIMCKTPALLPALELVLFNQTFTAMSDNGTWSPSDADMLNCIGSIALTAWSDTTLNSIATRFGLGFPFTLTGTSLFGQLVTRTAPTLTSTTDIVIGIQVLRD